MDRKAINPTYEKVKQLTGTNGKAFEQLAICFRDVNKKTRENGLIVQTRYHKTPYENKHYKFTFVYDVFNDSRVYNKYEYEFKEV